MFSRNRFRILLPVLASTISCSVLEPAVPAASFVHIDSISLETDYGTHGSRSNNITDAWIIYNNEFLGVFPLPADIPLIGEGPKTVSVKGGVYVNGQTGQRAAYPKYTSHDTTVTLVANSSVNLKPRATYISSAQFPQIEDFDDGSLSFETANVNYAQLTITSAGDPNALEGNSGKVTLDANHAVFEVTSASAFTLPLDIPIYLELDFKCSNEFHIGVYITTAIGVVKSSMITMNPTEGQWKKLYLSLNDVGAVQSSAILYKLYLEAQKSPAVTTSEIYLDNLKLVY